MLVEKLNTNRKTVGQVLTIVLGKRKVCARFAPQRLNEDQKIVHLGQSRDIVLTTENDPVFLDPIITGNEIWCFKYDPETKCHQAGETHSSLKRNMNW
ncbi:hypothetical protein Trydic_g8709 [Trypoxylus dichotomus]